MRARALVYVREHGAHRTRAQILPRMQARARAPQNCDREERRVVARVPQEESCVMGETTIAWTDYTYSPWRGCTKYGPGCDGCYAEARDLRYESGKDATEPA